VRHRGPDTIDRYTLEAQRLYGVMYKRLAKRRYLDSPAPRRLTSQCTLGCAADKPGIGPPILMDRLDEVAARSAVRRGVVVLAKLRCSVTDQRASTAMFGERQRLPALNPPRPSHANRLGPSMTAQWTRQWLEPTQNGRQKRQGEAEASPCVVLERDKRLELSTYTLARYRSTN